jgi:uncharacterized protein YraI
MHYRSTIFFATLMAAAAHSSPASAEITAVATTTLNMRSGPGPQYNVVGAIPDRGQATVVGCVQGSLWCQVSFNGTPGWAYSQYLIAALSGHPFTVADAVNTMPAVTYQEPAETVGSAAPSRTVTGTLITPPAALSAPPLPLTPPPSVRSYVVSHPVAPVYLNGEVVEGVGLPEDVALVPVPDYDHQYAYINNMPVLVEPLTRRIEYIYR